MTFITFSWLISISLMVFGICLMRCEGDKSVNCIRFLRNDTWGLSLFALASFWFLVKIWNLEEADFGAYKYWLLILFVSVFIGCGIYWKDFLVVRAIAMLTLMFCHLSLQIGYMNAAIIRPFLSLFFYFLIIVSLFFGSYPFKVRDILPILFKNNNRYLKYLGKVCIAYGGLLIVLLIKMLWDNLC